MVIGNTLNVSNGDFTDPKSQADHTLTASRTLDLNAQNDILEISNGKANDFDEESALKFNHRDEHGNY